MNSVFIITHIPKTAGSSLRVHFQKHLTDQIEFIHLANRGNNKARRLSLKPFHDRDTESRNKAKVIFGHQVNQSTNKLISDKPFKSVVIFRNPKDWEISRFNQYANVINKKNSALLTFSEWCDPTITPKLHSQFDWFLEKHLQTNTRNLSVEKRDLLLFETLKGFEFILFVEDFPDCLNPIFNDLNIPTKLTKNTNVVGVDKPNLYLSSEENQRLLTLMCDRDINTYNKLYAKFGLQ